MRREIEMQRNELAKMRLDNEAKGARIKELEERVVVQRPMSASRLPPMEGLETVTSMPDVAPPAAAEEEAPAAEAAPAAAEEEAPPAAEEEAPPAADAAPAEGEAPEAAAEPEA